MKTDKLEQYVRDHRNEFDDENPPSGIWNNIEQKLPAEKQGNKLFWIRLAGAAVLFILGGLTWALLNYLVNRNGREEIRRFSPIVERYVINNRKVNTESLKNRPKKHIVKEQYADNNNEKRKYKHSKDSSDYHVELKEIMAFYNSQISKKRSEIFRFASYSPEISQKLDVEFSQIDSIYNCMKSDLKDNIDNREVIEAIVLNYKVRIEILDAILRQLKEKDKTTENIRTYEI
jgi:hypothetical protein